MLRSSAAATRHLQTTQFLSPGFQLGFKDTQDPNRAYINNHLSFRIHVNATHGEYTAARNQYGASLSGLDVRRKLLQEPAASSPAPTPEPAAQMGGEEPQQQPQQQSQAPQFFMVVGFEVTPQSMKRDPAYPTLRTSDPQVRQTLIFWAVGERL